MQERRNWWSAIPPNKPVILVGAATVPPAWNDRDSLRDKVGADHIVRVEMGPYNNNNNSETLEIPFRDYLHYLELHEKEGGPLLYLAQNDLPDGLRDDFVLDVPDDRKLYQTMWWMGPQGCVSPLHYDPLDNFLCQMVGRKQVLLVDPRATDPETLCAGREYGQQVNTSAMDVEQLEGIPKWEGLLEPSDVLYIPSKWWHYVRSLESSISVNVWWR